MFERAKLDNLNEYFVEYTFRKNKGVYFCRLISWDDSILEFLIKFLDEARKYGIYINGKIPNPDERQLDFYEEIMGTDFQMNKVFIDNSLRKWLPRLDEKQRGSISVAMFFVLNELTLAKKTDNMVKNAYIKFMCWFYYKFERVLNQIGKDKLPKILYEGDISSYELYVFSILSKVGCDILLVEPNGDHGYKKVDPLLKESDLIDISGKPFKADFTIESLHKKQIIEKSVPVLEIEKPIMKLGTNTWLFGDVFLDTLKIHKNRGYDTGVLYNIFARVIGAEEKSTYFNELFKWKLKLSADKRNVLVIEKNIPIPDVFDVQKIKRKNYSNSQQMVYDIVKNISFPKNLELEKYAKMAFIDLMLEDKEISLQKLANRAIIILCWLEIHVKKLFITWEIQSMPVFLYYGVCNNLNEAYFLRILSRMPIDVLIVCPDLNYNCKLEDKFLFEKKFENSLERKSFPTQIEDVRFSTVAYNAQQDLESILYQDTGMYRNRQFKKAMPIVLETIYEEINILWEQEAKYRPNFEILDDRVILPVIFSKIMGVRDTKEEYWNEVSGLIDEDTFLITKVPYITGIALNPIKAHTSNFLKNQKIQFEKIKNSEVYQYSLIREDMQDYMLDKLQQLIDKKIIKSTGTSDIEMTIVSTVLNLDKQILRMIQKFDFTKAIPKVIIIIAGESILCLEDSIIVAYLNLLGFDIVVFVPTGYQSMERYFENSLFVEHQIGEYMYDLNVPDFKSLKRQRGSIASKLFRRGR